MPHEEDSGNITETLLASVQRGDESSARVLVEHLYPLVHRIVAAHRPRRMDVEDLSQEVFMSVFTDLAKYRGSAPFEHWVSRVAVTTCLDALRREKCRPELRWADLDEDETTVLESLRSEQRDADATDRIAARELLGKLMETIPARDRLLMHWLTLEGRSVAEVAERLGWGQSRVKVRAHRARLRMRTALSKLLKESHPAP